MDRRAGRATFGTGFGAEGCVLIHLIADARLPIDIFTLDTGLLFPETYTVWRALEARYGITIRAVQPEQTVEEQAASARTGALGARPHALLRASEARAAARCAGGQRPLGHRDSPRSDGRARRRAGRRARQAAWTAEGEPARSAGPRKTSGHSSGPTMCPTTRCTTPATRASAAGRARPLWPKGRIRAQDAGAASRRTNAAST